MSQQRPDPEPASSYVLVVDDNEDMRQLYAVLLDGEGCAVRVAADGWEALEVLRDEPRPAWAVLLDLEMPRLPGRAFLARKRADPVLRDVPVVVVSAVADLATLEPGPDVVATLGKPVDFAALVDVLHGLRAVQATWSRGAAPSAAGRSPVETAGRLPKV
jgi:CheY-like chemotaxis protein